MKTILNSDDMVVLAGQAVSTRNSLPAWLTSLKYADEPYYSFLYLLTKITEPELTVELGTDSGTSSIFLAYGAAPHTVATIDCNPTATENARLIADMHNLGNLNALTIDSCDPVLKKQLNLLKPRGRKPADPAAMSTPSVLELLFIDSDHNYSQAKKEFDYWRPLMAKGGLIVYDDIRYSPEMTRFWDEITDPKVELPTLHWTSFGVSFC